MPGDMTIRPATPGDAEAISALITKLASDYFLANPQAPEAAAPFFQQVTPEAIHSYLTSERYQYHVAMDRAGLAGAIGVRDSTHVYHLVVAKRAWRQGLARRLWLTARQTAALATPVISPSARPAMPCRYTSDSALKPVGLNDKRTASSSLR